MFLLLIFLLISLLNHTLCSLNLASSNVFSLQSDLNCIQIRFVHITTYCTEVHSLKWVTLAKEANLNDTEMNEIKC